MAEELQNLLDRIRKEGVEKAQAEAERIRAEARQEAARITAEAEKQAAATLEEADRGSKVFAERGQKALEQAARDLVLTIGEAISNAFRMIVQKDVNNALTTDTLKQLLAEVVRAYCVKQGDGGRIDLLVSPQQHKDIVDYFMTRFHGVIQDGVEIHADGQLARGFKVSLSDEHVYHDFSDDAILESLCQLLRPELAGIVRGMLPGSGKDKPSA